MEEFDLRDVAYEKIGRSYESQWDLMDDLFAWLDLLLYFFYKHHQWLGPKNDMRNMMGLVVSREEFEHNLAKAAQLGLCVRLSREEAAQLEASRTAIEARLVRTGEQFPLLLLFRRCVLSFSVRFTGINAPADRILSRIKLNLYRFLLVFVKRIRICQSRFDQRPVSPNQFSSLIIGNHYRNPLLSLSVFSRSSSLR